jgi:hypothetical protein
MNLEDTDWTALRARRGTWQARVSGRWFGLLLLAGATCSANAVEASRGLASAPFPARSVRTGPTLFTSVPATRTGITTRNTYSDPSMWGARYEVFALGSTGTGVTIADYDCDGRPDIYIVNKCDENRLYRNLGDWKFEDVTGSAGVSEPAGAWNQAAAFADVNNDGRPDLYVTRTGAPNLLFINVGGGRFVEEGAARGVAVVDGSGMAAFCDYDRDGWLDFYLQTNLLDPRAHPDGQRDRLFHNRGDGTFEEVTDHAGLFGETHGHSATWWDFDNDGWPDIYVANDFAAPDQLYHNNADGTFTDVLAQVVPHTPYYAMGADLGDVNNDGRVDLLVSDMQPTTREKDLRTMIEFRGIIPELPNPALPAPMARNALYLNTGTGRCLEAACLAGIAGTDWTWSVRFEDLDNDGRLDLFATNGMVRDFFDSDLRTRIVGQSPAQRQLAVKAMPVLNERNLAFRNRGDLHFEAVGPTWGLDRMGVSFGAAFGDLDGDGDLDLVVVNYESEPTLYRNDCDRGHSLVVALRGTVSNRFGIGAEVSVETETDRQVRPLVLARGYMSSSEPVLHFGLGDAAVVRRLTVVWPSGRRQVFDHLPADRRYTVTENTEASDSTTAADSPSVTPRFSEVSGPLGLALVSKEPPLDEWKDQPLLPFRQNRIGPALAIGDLDGDGRDDVIVGGAAGEPAQILLGAGGHFSAPLVSGRTTGAADAASLIFDADGDGLDDWLLAKGGVALSRNDPGYQPRLFFSRGGRRFREAPAGTLPAYTESAGALVAADFNRDGRLDVFVGGQVVPGAYGSTPRSAIWLNHGGTFTDETQVLAPELANVGMISAALATDVDGDGWPDLLVASSWGRVACWHNRDGKGFDEWTERLGFSTAGSGWWNSLAAADFNGDGRIDYVVGNLGLNTPYQAAPDRPVLLYRGRFAGSDRERLVEAIVDGGIEYPRRGRTTMTRVWPGLTRKFPTFDGYARATLQQLFGDDLKNATRLEATELGSGVFLSQPDGTFRFAALPRLAQVAPIFGLVAGDFDGDGQADVCAVQNSYAPTPETGRFDGGLGQYLRGDGRGGFETVPLNESGLLVTGDGKALAVCDFDGDGWPDLVATRSDASVLAFRNRPDRAATMFAVALRGGRSNPHAIGARIEILMTGGSSQIAEVAAGGGYRSQSSTRRFFGYRRDDPPRAIRVHWPDGGISVREWVGAAAEIVIDRSTP